MRRSFWRGRMSAVVRSLVVIMALGALISCQGSRPTKGDVIVYVAAPLSGWQADGGQTVAGGVRLAAEEINNQGGLLGYRVVVEALDDEADSDVAVQVANTVAQAVRGPQRVIGVIGHYNSGQCAVALETYDTLPIIVITPTASDPSLTAKGYRRFFRVNATDAAQGPADASFLVQDLGAKRIVLVYADNDYGRALGAEVQTALTNLGAAPVEAILIPEAADTYAAVLPRIRDAQPDAIFLAGYETEGYVLLPELREAGITATFMASDGCFLYEFVDGSGLWAEGVYVSGITPDSRGVTSSEWLAEYQALEARNPGTYSVAGYSAMLVLAEGVKKAGSFDADATAAALKGMSIKSPMGTISYDDKGDMQQQQIYIFQVRDGEFQQVKPALP